MDDNRLEKQHTENLRLIEEAKLTGDFSKVLASLQETRELLKQVSEEQLEEMKKVFGAH